MKETNKEAIELATKIATIDELEAYFQINRYDEKFIIAIAELNKAVYGKDGE